MNNFIPRMIEVRQSYPPSRQLDFPSLLARQFADTGIAGKIRPGMTIAVGVGSRGISNLKEIVKATIDLLKSAGAKPFVVPAMGSHGGATAEGQTKVLAEFGITSEYLGVPIQASMEVRSIGTVLNGQEVLFSVPALEADAVIPINRVKPHTDFRGPLGSGVLKMLTIGFGKQAGANSAHRAVVRLGHETVVREFSGLILSTVPVLCGIAIVEDQRHQTAEIAVLRPEGMVSAEERLLENARQLMPRLPLDEIDLLIVDEIGKEISGAGMDPNVTGRDGSGYSDSLLAKSGWAPPNVFRILVRDLSVATNGNGIGIGMADFATARAVKALDLRYTYMNALTAIKLLSSKIPIHFDSDREAIEQGLKTLPTERPESLRVMRIANTLSLERLLVSESCVKLLEGRPGISFTGTPQPMQFDKDGNLSRL
ncbi:MAG TPA: DUF362 domain-containing protein [Terracidiphilus sp.]|nr:DUF362 domain-containing protein [Terracidiphilus sp.]